MHADDLLDRIRAVEFSGGDAEVLFDAEAERGIEDLLVHAVQQGMGVAGTTAEHASTLFTVGTLLLCRTQNPTKEYGWDR